MTNRVRSPPASLLHERRPAGIEDEAKQPPLGLKTSIRDFLLTFPRQVSVKNSPKISEFFLTTLLATMDMMKKISFTVVVVAATMSTIAVASRDVLAPAPAPAEATSGASAAVGSLVGASLMSLVALYLQ
ncbi:hypothetical protein Dsin_019235 [Dipteronia sinensis]|uniref:Uncharacterized protein n=1 Tax=Dipteronia sinensis TaxID=43782 RepID=A0AAE0A7N1_9ROSI|nr:hypothetical protein Dsin_019235 [Dipteronia sinensis]